MDYTAIAAQQAASKEAEFKQQLLVKIDSLILKVDALEKKIEAQKAKPSKE